MSRQSRTWRDDRLGTTLREGVRPLRSAAPSDKLWQRIANEIPAQRASRRPSVTFQRASILSVVLMIGLAATGLGVQLRGSASGTTSWPAASDFRLTPLEMQVAERAAVAEWDRIMPPEQAPLFRGPLFRRHAVPREAYNRAQWQAYARPPLGGTVMPLQSVSGL